MGKVASFQYVRAILSTINLSRICVSLEQSSNLTKDAFLQLLHHEKKQLQQLEGFAYNPLIENHLNNENTDNEQADLESSELVAGSGEGDENVVFLRDAIEKCTCYIDFLGQSLNLMEFPNAITHRALVVVLMRLKLIGARWILSTYDVAEGRYDESEFDSALRHMRQYTEIGSSTYDRQVVSMLDVVGVASNLIANLLRNLMEIPASSAPASSSSASSEGLYFTLISGKERGMAFRLFMEDLQEVAIVSSGTWMAGSIEPSTPVITLALSRNLVPRYPRHFAAPSNDERVKAREEISATVWAQSRDKRVLMCKTHNCDRVELNDGEVPVTFVDLFCAFFSTEGGRGLHEFCLKNIDDQYHPLNDDGSPINNNSSASNSTFITRNLAEMPNCGKEQTMRLRLFLYGTTERQPTINSAELDAKINGELADGSIVKDYFLKHRERIKTSIAAEHNGKLDDELEEDFNRIYEALSQASSDEESHQHHDEQSTRHRHHALDRRYRKLKAETRWHREVQLLRPKGYEMKDITLEEFNYVDKDGIRRRLKADENGFLTGIRGACQRGVKFGISGRLGIPPLQGIVSMERERKEDVIPHTKQVLSYFSSSVPTAAVRMALRHMEILDVKKSVASASYVPNGKKEIVVIDHIEAVRLRLFNDLDAYYNPSTRELVVKTFVKLYTLKKVDDVEGRGMYQLEEKSSLPGQDFLLCSMRVRGGLLG